MVYALPEAEGRQATRNGKRSASGRTEGRGFIGTRFSSQNAEKGRLILPCFQTKAMWASGSFSAQM
jgi:hypothetical protein